SQPNRRDHTAQKWPCVNKGGFTPLRGRATMPRHFGPVPEDGPVKPKTLGLVAALVALPTAAAVIPGRLAGATAPAQRAGAASSTWRAAEPAAPGIGVASDSGVSSPRADHTYELMFSSLGGRTLAVTYTWRWSTGEYESDTVFSTSVPWFIAPGEGDGCYEGTARYDLQNVATHEFGHVY